MSRYNALCAAGALVVTSVVWYPDLLPAACLVAGLVAFLAIAVGRPRQPRTITRMPTAYEREHARWVPGAGLGFSLFHWPPRPFLFLTFWRWRR
jgi:hypothetical protein